MIGSLRMSAAGDATPITPHWDIVVGAGRAAEALRGDWMSHLDYLQEHIGFGYVRFHGVFHGDMFVYAEIDGAVDPYFQYVDLVFDGLLQRGIRPFVELGFAPPELARETGTVFWWGANGSPPVDLDKWSALVARTVEHWVGRYGIDEVLQWYFEVWNEPNLDPFFRGTRSEYFELYRASVTAVRSVDQRLRVGGPATSNFVPDARFAGETEDLAEHETVINSTDLDSLEWKPVWLTEFLQFCHDNQLPVDFVSSHPYPTDWALDEHSQGRKLTRGVDATPSDLATLRRMVDASPFPAAEIHLTEWSSSSSPRDYTHDYLQAATFIVRSNLRSIGLVDSLAYWVFTDIFEESGAGQEPFHGGFGMITQHGIPKPSFHAYRMLTQLGDSLLSELDFGVVTRDSATGRVTALFYNYPDEEPRSVPASFDTREVADATLGIGHPRRVDLIVTDLTPKDQYVIEILDENNGDAITAWRALGSPRNLSVAERDELMRGATATSIETVTVDASGTLRVDAMIAAWGLMQVRPASPSAPPTLE